MHLRKIVPLFFLFCCIGFSPAAQAQSAQATVQQWLHLRDSREYYDFLTYARFLNNHPGWPQENAVRLNAEGALLRDGADSGTVADWFTRHAPVTDEGRLRYVLALQQTGNSLAAQQTAREYWHQGYFDTGRQARLLIAMRGVLGTEDHNARMDTLLWNGNLSRAETLLPQVGPETRAIAKARIALQRSSSKAASFVSAVPNNRRSTDNGLMFDRVRLARVRGDDNFANQLLNQYSGTYGQHDSQWWRERHILARRAFEKGNYQQAYQLAARHRCTKDADYAEAEWFAGWLALTRLHQPRTGFDHFERMYRRVVTPMSKARAAYWTGTAAEELKQPTVANEWFRSAARHPHVFYGLMSAYALNTPKESVNAFMSRNQHVGPGAISSLPSDMVEAARIMTRMGKTKERDMFLNTLIAKAKEKGNPQAVIPLAKELNSSPGTLLAGKAAYEKGILVLDALFPRINVAPVDGVEPALTLAIMRQESLFDRHAISSAQARGLMQLLNGTAAHVAKRYGVRYAGPQSLFEPTTNTRLGQLYLKDLLSRYNGFAPLSIAAYNAGPGNVSKFLAMNGDPRRKGADWTDWVERIPFYETRNYVQRVWEAYIIYGYLLQR
ncbi:MAG TPA: lytic transglycosylase domain-containing protein [Alphaproteobacteria bacterium]